VAVSRLSRRLRTTAAGAGLTPTQLSVFATLCVRGPLRVSELASIEAINPTMLSRIVGKLDEAGLVRRWTDETDRRVAYVEAKPKGRRLHERIRAERTQAFISRLDRLDESQLVALFSALPALEVLAED
jgi:DNA-binding MarR family transcriptional regulator